MAERNRITERAYSAGQESKAAVLGSSNELGAFLMFGNTGTPATADGAMSLYEQSTAVSVPINMIGDAFAQIKPVLQLDEGEYTIDAEVIRFLNAPSPDFTQALFMEVLAKHYLIAAETEIVAMGGIGGPPTELQPINPRNVSIIPAADGRLGAVHIGGNTLAGSYTRKREGRRVRYLQGGMLEVKQVRGFSTKDNSLLRGQSLLVSAAQEARQHILGGQHNVSLLTKGGRPTLVLHYATDTGAMLEDFDETKREVNANVAGASNAGGIIVTQGGNLSVENLSTSNVDMDFGKLQSMAKQAVALQYHVPLPLISMDAATLDNLGIAVLQLWDDAVLPLSNRLFGALSEMLLPRFGLDPSQVRITFNPDQITALQTRRVEQLAKLKDLDTHSDNELRKLQGMEGYGPEGDVHLKPANLVPVGTNLFDDNDVVLGDE